MTQEQLAHQIGCATITLRKIEAEERLPSAQIVERLAVILEVPPDEQKNFLKYARGDWSYAPAEKTGKNPWRAADRSPRTNLPATVTTLIGREQSLAEVCNYLTQAEVRLVTLIGPPGMGKTRLSIEAARQLLSDFPDGVFFVRLALLEDPSMIASRTLQALGYVESGKLSAAQQLTGGIGDKQMLIVLDNCEHLIGDVAELASKLLSVCSRLKILATSRESLRIPGEWLYAVPPLESPKDDFSTDVESTSQYPAMILFAERARAVRSDFVLTTDNLRSVARICARLDGLPLAIELIAAQMRLHSPQSLLEHLSDKFILSAQGARMDSSHQTSLNQAIGWSYGSLTPEEQRLFAYLSMFAGGFTIPTVEKIFLQQFPTQPVSDLITSLLDKSLLQRSPDSASEPRFGMLVTIRQFALDTLVQMDKESESRNWHMNYFLELAEQADQEIHGPNQVRWMDRLESEHDNFRTALNWCVSNQKTESALRMLTALAWSWVLRNHPRETVNWFNVIRLLPGIMDHPVRYARLLNQVGRTNWFMGDFRTAQSILEESRAILANFGADGEHDLGMTLCWMGMTARSIDQNTNTAQPFLEKSFEKYQEHKDKWGTAFVLLHLGHNAGMRNENAMALLLINQSLGLFRQLGDVWGMGFAFVILGYRFEKQGNHEKARLLFEQYLLIQEELHFKQGITHALLSLGELCLEQSQYDQAEQFFQKSLEISREYDLRWPLCNTSYDLGLLALLRKDYPPARQYFTSNYEYARTIYSDEQSACDLLSALAAVAAGDNQPERAAKLYGAALAIMAIIEYQIPASLLSVLDSYLQIARKQLGDVKYEELNAQGRVMTLKQAIAYSLEEQGG